MKERHIVVNKVTFAEADEQELLYWQNVSFEEKWKSLERLRETFYKMHGLDFSTKVAKVITKVKNGISK